MNKLILILLLVLISNCATPIYLSPTGGSKSDGTIKMSYQYNSFQVPEVEWGEAKKIAIEKCSSWGYTDAEKFGSGFETCLSRNQYGSCTNTRVDVEYQCID